MKQWLRATGRAAVPAHRLTLRRPRRWLSMVKQVKPLPPEHVAFLVRHWLDATRLQLGRIKDPAVDDDLDADVDFLTVALYQLDRACGRAGDPLPSLKLVHRIRHEVEHPEDRHPDHVYLMGDDFLTLWSWALGTHGQEPASGAMVEVVQEAEAAIAHADALVERLPDMPSDLFADVEGEDIDSLADATARAIRDAWQE